MTQTIQQKQNKTKQNNTAAHAVVANSDAYRQEMSKSLIFKRSRNLKSSEFQRRRLPCPVLGAECSHGLRCGHAVSHFEKQEKE